MPIFMSSGFSNACLKYVIQFRSDRRPKSSLSSRKGDPATAEAAAAAGVLGQILLVVVLRIEKLRVGNDLRRDGSAARGFQGAGALTAARLGEFLLLMSWRFVTSIAWSRPGRALSGVGICVLLRNMNMVEALVLNASRVECRMWARGWIAR
jgi:hypothetical protein